MAVGSRGSEKLYLGPINRSQNFKKCLAAYRDTGTQVDLSIAIPNGLLGVFIIQNLLHWFLEGFALVLRLAERYASKNGARTSLL